MKWLSTLMVALVIVCLPTAPAQAEQPLYGDMALEFNLGWSGPGLDIPEWVGTITIDGADYPMAFFNMGSGKPFVDPFTGNVLFFGEVWKVYDWMTFDFVSQTLVEGPVLLWGTDEGVVTLANDKYRMNGTVEGATGRFAWLQGRPVHMSGIIEWFPFGAPQYAPGTLRVN